MSLELNNENKKNEKQGYFTGTYNALVGQVKNSREILYKIQGKWSDQMFIQSTKAKVFFLY